MDKWTRLRYDSPIWVKMSGFATSKYEFKILGKWPNKWIGYRRPGKGRGD